VRRACGCGQRGCGVGRVGVRAQSGGSASLSTRNKCVHNQGAAQRDLLVGVGRKGEWGRMASAGVASRAQYMPSVKDAGGVDGEVGFHHGLQCGCLHSTGFALHTCRVGYHAHGAMPMPGPSWSIAEWASSGCLCVSGLSAASQR